MSNIRIPPVKKLRLNIKQGVIMSELTLTQNALGAANVYIAGQGRVEDKHLRWIDYQNALSALEVFLIDKGRSRDVYLKEYGKRHRQLPNVKAARRAEHKARTARVNNTTLENASLHCSRWEEPEDKFLLENSSRMTVRQMATHLKRSFCSVKARLWKLRRKKKS